MPKLTFIVVGKVSAVHALIGLLALTRIFFAETSRPVRLMPNLFRLLSLLLTLVVLLRFFPVAAGDADRSGNAPSGLVVDRDITSPGTTVEVLGRSLVLTLLTYMIEQWSSISTYKVMGGAQIFRPSGETLLTLLLV